jgi:uncharacterized protein
MSHVETVKRIYEAFGRGDVPAILDQLADDVVWDVWDAPGSAQQQIFYIQPRRGKQEVGEFFASLAGLEFHEFDVSNILDGGDQVAGVIKLDLTVKSTGKRLQDLEIHLWTFNTDGKVVALRHVFDTAKHAEAQRG